MKTNLVKLFGVLAVNTALIVNQAAATGTDFTKVLAGTSVLEVPAKAADLIAAASEADRQSVAENVVNAAVRMQPSSVIAIVASVCRTNPKIAPTAAVAGVTLQHKLLGSIVKAAVSAAPEQTSQIVAALIREFPSDYGQVAISASEAAPTMGREILSVVAEFVPALQASINGTVSTFASKDSTLPVTAILMESYDHALSSGTAASQPAYYSAASIEAAGPGQSVVSRAYTSPSPLIVNAPISSRLGSSGNATSSTGYTPGSLTAPTINTPAPMAAAVASVPPPMSLGGSSFTPPTIGPPYQPIPGPITSYGPSQTQLAPPSSYVSP